MNEKNYLICVPWDLREDIPGLITAQRLCKMCGIEVVVEAANAKYCDSKRIDIVCMFCQKSIPGKVKDVRGMIGGKGMTLPDALKQIKKLTEN